MAKIASTADWEARQRHATFYQSKIANIQQGAVAALTGSTIIFTVLAVFVKDLELDSEGRTVVIGAAILVWLLLLFMLSASHGASASRVRETYIKEHALLFAGTRPYRLESFLLESADRMPQVGRWFAKRRVSPASNEREEEKFD